MQEKKEKHAGKKGENTVEHTGVSAHKHAPQKFEEKTSEMRWT